jgi:hypothetical protein
MDTKKKVLAYTYYYAFRAPTQRYVCHLTNGMGNVFWKLSIDLVTRVALACGITQKKNEFYRIHNLDEKHRKYLEDLRW